MSNAKPNSMRARIREDAIEAEHLLWRALCDGKPAALRKHLADDAVLAFPGQEPGIVSPSSDPSLTAFLDGRFKPWSAYQIKGEPDFVEIDMMAASLTYYVTAWRRHGQDMHPTEGLCCTVWRQGPGGDWKCCNHQMARL